MSPFTPTVAPAERYVVFSDDAGQVSVIDEAVLTQDGVTFVGTWESPTLNRGDLARLQTLHSLTLYYLYDEVSPTSLDVAFTGDGGVTYTTPVTVTIPVGKSRVIVGAFVTGDDIRFELYFNQDPIVTTIGYRPVLKPAGLADIGLP
jgi:hypothetical protein